MYANTHYKDGVFDKIVSGKIDHTIIPYEERAYDVIKKAVNSNNSFRLLCNKSEGGGYDYLDVIYRYVEILDISDYNHPFIQDRLNFEPEKFAKEEGFKSFNWFSLYLHNRFDSRKKYLIVWWYAFESEQEEELFKKYLNLYKPLPFPNTCDRCSKTRNNRFVVEIDGKTSNLCVKCISESIEKS